LKSLIYFIHKIALFEITVVLPFFLVVALHNLDNFFLLQFNCSPTVVAAKRGTSGCLSHRVGVSKAAQMTVRAYEIVLEATSPRLTVI